MGIEGEKALNNRYLVWLTYYANLIWGDESQTRASLKGIMIYNLAH